MGMVTARRLGRASHTDGRASRRLVAARGASRWLSRKPDEPTAQLWCALRAGRPRFSDGRRGLARHRSLHAPADELRRLSLIADALKGRFAQAEPLLRQAFNDDPRPDPLVAEALAELSGIYDLQLAGIAHETLDAGRSAPSSRISRRVEIDRRTGDTRAVEADYRAVVHARSERTQSPARSRQAAPQAHRNTEAGLEPRT